MTNLKLNGHSRSISTSTTSWSDLDRESTFQKPKINPDFTVEESRVYEVKKKEVIREAELLLREIPLLIAFKCYHCRGTGRVSQFYFRKKRYFLAAYLHFVKVETYKEETKTYLRSSEEFKAMIATGEKTELSVNTKQCPHCKGTGIEL